MASAHQKIGDVSKVLFSLIFWFLPRNQRSAENTKPDDKLIGSLKYGWDSSQGTIPAELIEEASARDGMDYLKIALELRQRDYDAIKGDTSADAAAKRKAWEELFLDEKGKIIPPKYIANACYRRSLSYLPAQVLRLQNVTDDEQKKPMPLKVEKSVPMELVHYESAMEQIRHNLEENERKHEGFVPLTWREHINSAKPLFNLGMTDSQFRDTYRSGTGQKLYNVMLLDKRFPNVHIVDRLKSEETADGHIPWGPIKVDALTSMNHRFKADKLRVVKGVKEVQTTEEEVKEYFQNVRQAGGPRQMKRDRIEALADQCPAQIVADVANAILNDNTGPISRYTLIAEGLNLLSELQQLGLYDEARKALEGIKAKALGSVQKEPAQKEPAKKPEMAKA